MKGSGVPQRKEVMKAVLQQQGDKGKQCYHGNKAASEQ
jgi:hypothetical protein